MNSVWDQRSNADVQAERGAGWRAASEMNAQVTLWRCDITSAKSANSICLSFFLPSSLWHRHILNNHIIYMINTGNGSKGDKRTHQRWQSFSCSSLSLLSHFQKVLLWALWHLPLRAYDQVVALTSVRQGEIKHATVRRHTRRIKLQRLTCGIKKPASIRHVDKRDTESEREGREMGAGCDVRRNESLSITYWLLL